MGLLAQFLRQRESNKLAAENQMLAAEEAKQIRSLLGSQESLTQAPVNQQGLAESYLPATEGSVQGIQRQQAQQGLLGDPAMAAVPTEYTGGAMTPFSMDALSGAVSPAQYQPATGFASEDPNERAFAMAQIAARNPQIGAALAGIEGQRQDALAPPDGKAPTSIYGQASTMNDPATGEFYQVAVNKNTQRMEEIPGSRTTSTPESLAARASFTTDAAGRPIQLTSGTVPTLGQMGQAAGPVDQLGDQPSTPATAVAQKYQMPSLPARPTSLDVDNLGRKYKANETAWADIQLNTTTTTSLANKGREIAELYGSLPAGWIGKTEIKLRELASATGLPSAETEAMVARAGRARALEEELTISAKNKGGKNQMPGAMTEREWDILRGTLPGMSKTPEGRKMIATFWEANAADARAYEDFVQEFMQNGGDLASVEKAARDYFKGTPSQSKALFEQISGYAKAEESQESDEDFLRRLQGN